jgi:hypothetical protein
LLGVIVNVGEPVPKRSAARFLLFPILVFVFFVGWVLRAVGEPTAKPQPQTAPKKPKPPKDLEMGLLAAVQRANRPKLARHRRQPTTPPAALCFHMFLAENVLKALKLRISLCQCT